MTHGGPDAVHAGAERAVALLIRRRHVDEGEIGLDVALLEQTRDLVQENGDAVGSAGVHRRPHVAADEQADGPEVF